MNNKIRGYVLVACCAVSTNLFAKSLVELINPCSTPVFYKIDKGKGSIKRESSIKQYLASCKYQVQWFTTKEAWQDSGPKYPAYIAQKKLQVNGPKDSGYKAKKCKPVTFPKDNCPQSVKVQAK